MKIGVIMRSKENMARISIDVTKEQHRKLKARAALSGKTLQQFFLDSVGEVPEQELWLYDPANKELIERLKKSFKEDSTVDWDSIKHKFE